MGVYKCPVCEGKGQVPAGFYFTNAAPTVVNTCPETCKSCGGKGIVFDADMFSGNVYNQHHQGDPGYMTFQCKGTCSNCEHNDRVCYTSNPVKYKCTLYNTWHEADYRCKHWAEQQQKYLQGTPGTFQWMGVDLSTEPRTNKEELDSYVRLNATGTEDSTIEGLTKSNSID